MSELIAKSLVDRAKVGAPREICGFILELDSGGWLIEPIANVATGDSEFRMDPDEQLKVYERDFDRIVGVYHSHPGGSSLPSYDDMHWAPVGMRYWIVTLEGVYEWTVNSDGVTTFTWGWNERPENLAAEVCQSTTDVRQRD
jgi:proteasome lid subunit RPN8/RPN11